MMKKKKNMTPERMREFEKVVLLRSIDSKWMDHIDAMDQLRQGIHLRAYGQIRSTSRISKRRICYV